MFGVLGKDAATIITRIQNGKDFLLRKEAHPAARHTPSKKGQVP